MLESILEKKLSQRVKSLGGMFLKWVSPNFTGVPDRILLLNGKLFFVELKTPKGRLSKRQQRVHEMFKAQGFEPCVIHSEEEFNILLEEFLK